VSPVRAPAYCPGHVLSCGQAQERLIGYTQYLVQPPDRVIESLDEWLASQVGRRAFPATVPATVGVGSRPGAATHSSRLGWPLLFVHVCCVEVYCVYVYVYVPFVVIGCHWLPQAEPLVTRLSVPNVGEVVVDSPTLHPLPEGPESCRSMGSGDVFTGSAVRVHGPSGGCVCLYVCMCVSGGGGERASALHHTTRRACTSFP
jgi:hypothetical protein